MQGSLQRDILPAFTHTT